MHFAFIFLLLVFVSGYCDSSRNGVTETSKAFWKSASKAGKHIIHAGKLARTIHGHITSAMLRGNPNSKLALEDQFAWLYLHGPFKGVMYENDIVRNVLLGTDPFPFVTSQWPENAFATNLLLAIPDKGPENMLGHAERKLLRYQEDMRLGFAERNKACPNYAILGTVLDPCRYSNKQGCAYEIISKMKEFTTDEKCPVTEFMLYVHRPKQNYLHFWERTKRLMVNNGIGVIQGSNILSTDENLEPMD